MLLSMFAAFLLRRRFNGRIYGLLLIVGLLLTSLFSVGIPEYRLDEYVFLTRENGILVHYPLPFSFPLFASLVFNERQIRNSDTLWYRLYLFNILIQEDWVYFSRVLNFTWFEYVLYYSLFMLVNIAGAVLGYWLSRRTAVFPKQPSAR